MGDGGHRVLFAFGGTDGLEYEPSFIDPDEGQVFSSLAAGDINGDEFIDVLLTGNDAVYLYESQEGYFGAPEVVPVGSGTSPVAVVVADFNGDGHNDLATANSATATVSVMLGDGIGFGLPQQFPVGSAPIGISADDVDEDSHVDLVVTQASGAVTVLFGNGFFDLSLSVTAGGAASAAVVTDVNADTVVDLALSTFNGIVLLHGMAPSVCGDGTCSSDEDAGCCPQDCGGAPEEVCGDGTCQAGEDCSSCSSDCGVCGPVCGDGTCQAGEDCGSCESDCGVCGPVCGDGTCQAGEDCGSCESDCGVCGPVCGDGTCEAGEDCGSCESDCGVCGPTTEIDCSNSVDDDSDGQTDCDDADCADDPACTGGGEILVVNTSSAAAVSTSLSVSVPTGIQDNDVLYAFVTKDDNGGVLSGPAGWVRIGRWETTAGRDFTTGVWRRVITDAASEPGSYTFSHTDGSEEMTVQCVALRGVDIANPEDVAVAHSAGKNDNTPDSPSLTTETANAMVLVHQGFTHAAASVIGTPSGATLLESNKQKHRNSGLALFVQTSPGATGAAHWPNSGGSGNAEWHTMTLAVRAQ